VTANDGRDIFCPRLQLASLLWAPKSILRAVLHHLDEDFCNFDFSCKALSSLLLYIFKTDRRGREFGS
jgi:hypothetical protein